MVECSIDLRRGGFHIHLEAQFIAPWTVVFGPSGSGKSTLLRILAGLELGGKTLIAIDGQDISRLKAGTRRIGLVTQQAALFPHLSIPANLAYGLHGMGHAAQQERVRQMLELVGGEHLATRRVKQLSGGEAQRIALARALAPLPRVLLMDEPFSALDGAASDALLERLQPWLCERGIQVLLVTHDATDAFVTDAEVVLIQAGRITAQGPAFEVLRSERERLERGLNAAQKPTSTGSISN